MSLSRAFKYYMKRLGRRILHPNKSAEQIAGGVWVGTVAGFLPIPTGQMLVAAVMATIFRVSRIPAIAMVYITNPLTNVPIYGSCYLLGVGLMKPFGFEPLKWERIRRFFIMDSGQGFWQEAQLKFSEAVGIGWRGMAPMTIGCLIEGILFGALFYYITLRFVTGHRLLKAQRMAHRAKTRLDKVRARQSSGEAANE